MKSFYLTEEDYWDDYADMQHNPLPLYLEDQTDYSERWEDESEPSVTLIDAFWNLERAIIDFTYSAEVNCEGKIPF